MHRYLYVLMVQLAETAGCLRYHQIGPRLPRWLLRCQDQANADTFPETLAFLSFMLGVRRVGTIGGASEPQREGLIEYHRGHLSVLNRRGLNRPPASATPQICKTTGRRRPNVLEKRLESIKTMESTSATWVAESRESREKR